MSERNMTGIEVDGFQYRLSTAARNHIYEVLAPYSDTKENAEAPALYSPTPPPETPLRTISKEPEKKPIFGKKDKKKK